MSGTLRTAQPPVNDDTALPEGESLQAIACVLAVFSLVALLTALVTNHDVFAWVCSGVSGAGVVVLIVDAVRDRRVRADARAGDQPRCVRLGVLRGERSGGGGAHRRRRPRSPGARGRPCW